MKRHLGGAFITLTLLCAGLAPAGALAGDSSVQIAKRNQALVIGRVSGDSVETVQKLTTETAFLGLDFDSFSTKWAFFSFHFLSQLPTLQLKKRWDEYV